LALVLSSQTMIFQICNHLLRPVKVAG
jgi:hypothetical protein